MYTIDRLKYKKYGFLSGIMSILLIVIGACSDDNSTGTDVWETPGNVVVSTIPERTAIVKNPMMGWVLYAGLGDGLADSYWEDYDNMQSSAGIVRVSDYATTLFIRASWTDFNPEEGKYAWDEDVNTKAAQRFKMLVEGAAERGLKLAFAVIIDSQDKSYDFTPAYVKNGGAAGYTSQTGSKTVWSPYPDDPVFQQYYEKFIMDFAKKYNDPDVVQYFSGQGFGKWGESHTVFYSTGDNTPREAVFNWSTDLMRNAFDKIPVVVYYHRYIGLRGTDSGYDEETERLLQSAVDKGYCLRHDAFGMKSYYSTWERAFAASQRYKRPIIMEGGWVKKTHGNSIKGDGYNDFADVRHGEFDEGKGSYVNMMDLRYSSDIINGETYSWFNDAYGLVQEFIAEGGYRLYPDKISVPYEVANGSTLHITHRWSNLGWGYCPTNIPQWKDKYQVAFALLDKNTLQPKYTFLDSEPALSDWIEGSPKTYTFNLKLTDVAAGDYLWAVGLVDTTKDNTIGIQISAKKDRLTTEGWLKLCDVTVH